MHIMTMMIILEQLPNSSKVSCRSYDMSVVPQKFSWYVDRTKQNSEKNRTLTYTFSSI